MDSAQTELDDLVKLGSDMDTWQSGLTASAAALQTALDAAVAQGTADAATLAGLQGQVSDLQTQLSRAPEVIAAIDALDTKVSATPSTTTTPAPSTSTTPAPVQPV